MVGAWCFADHMGPQSLDPSRSIDVAPHPHIGLQTVTWLFSGEILHRDSLGSEQLIRPGQLNLMTAGHGVAHSEENPGRTSGVLHGIQLWVAQPNATRSGESYFEHVAQLPRIDLDNAVATVVVGDIDGVRSPARRDSEHVAVELDLHGGTTEVSLRANYEYALIVVTGEVLVDGVSAVAGQLAYVGARRDEIRLSARDGARAMLIGGVPFDEQVFMWWNFVARTKEEIADAWLAWASGGERFASVASRFARIDVAPPPWVLANN